MSRLFSMILLALSIGVVGCGADDGGDEGTTEVDASAVAGGAPILVAAGERLSINPEPGYGWTVLHCKVRGTSEHCVDASPEYGTDNGVLAWCFGIDVNTQDPELHSVCSPSAVDFDRWVRLH